MRSRPSCSAPRAGSRTTRARRDCCRCAARRRPPASRRPRWCGSRGPWATRTTRRCAARYQESMAGRPLDFGRRATALQAAPEAARPGRLAQAIVRSQIDDVQSVLALNSPRADRGRGRRHRGRRPRRLPRRARELRHRVPVPLRVQPHRPQRRAVRRASAARCWTRPTRSSDGDVLVAISQAPYSAPTVRRRRTPPPRAGSPSSRSPTARSRRSRARRDAHAAVSRRVGVVLPFDAGPPGAGRAAARADGGAGGKAVLRRLDEVERRLAEHHAYWRPRSARAGE